MTDIILINTPFHVRAQLQRVVDNRPRETYTLSWQKAGRVHSISCSCATQIHRQMKSLAGRAIAATVHKGDVPVACVGPTPDGVYKIIFMAKEFAAEI